MEIEVRCLAQDRSARLEFEVRDTGIGIPPDSVRQLFQPFVQADASMARRFGGSGLGLSICKSLVQLMGGDIQVESSPAGTKFFFTVRLLLAKELPCDGPEPEIASAASSAPLRILLVEDNLANQKLANYVLRDRGHQVDNAVNGKEAVELTEQIRYDVILMDVQMPIMNGLDATVAIRNRDKPNAAGRRVPIIAMTAHATPSDRARCNAAGMDGYLCKPVKREELVAAVEQLAANAADPAVEPSTSTNEAGSAYTGQHFEDFDGSPVNFRQAMVRLDGNTKLFRDMAEYFFNDAIELMPEIRSATARGDLETLAEKAHWFKGTVLYLGAEAVTSALDRVERLSRAGDQTGAASAVDILDAEVASLATALHRIVPQITGQTDSARRTALSPGV